MTLYRRLCIPKKKKCKKAKWLSEEALQILKKEVKGKGEKEKYTHLNAEFQRIARRHKKAFLSDQLQRSRGKQQNGKDLRSRQESKRYQGNISCKDGLNKGQKWYGPNRSREIKKRWPEYTENYTKKILTTQTTTMV